MSEAVPKIFHSPSLPQGQADFGSCFFRPTVKSPSNQASTKQSHHTLDSSFLPSFQIVWPNVSSLDSLRPISTNDYDVPALQSHSNAGSLTQNASKQKLIEK
jgi:hypothetical protein